MPDVLSGKLNKGLNVMPNKDENEFDYIAAYQILKSLYSDGVISFDLFDKINRSNAAEMGVKPIIEFSHICHGSDNTVE